MAELSKCCSAFSVANIAVPSNIAKCCRVLYKRKQEVCNVCRAYRCDGSFKYCSAFNGCNYFADLKNVANVAKTFRNKKANIAEPTDMVELSNVAMLSYVANITVPSKYCNMLQNSKKKNKCVKFAKLAEPSNVAELSKCYSAFKCCKCCKDLKNVANVANFLEKKEKERKNMHMLRSLQKEQNFQIFAGFKMLRILQSSQEF